MKTIYYIQVNTTNPSADVNGYFDNEEDANTEIEKIVKVIRSQPDYYGEWDRCSITKTIIPVDNFLSL